MKLLKTSIKATLLTIVSFTGIIALFVFTSQNLLHIFRENFGSKTKQIFVPLISPKISIGLPTRLIVPEIGIDSFVEYVGVTQEGKMDIPKGPTTTAWFNLGPRPGEDGSAVISGHFGWKNNVPAVFDNLHKLKIGARVYVVDESGVVTSFVVREIKLYDQDANAFDVFDTSDGQSHLNLVTCQGVWRDSTKSYSKRLVVFTDKE